MSIVRFRTPKAQSMWKGLRSAWSSCQMCSISAFAHNHVLGEGTLPCDLLFIGEGPGKTEDATGRPFIGRAGQILRKMILMCSEHTWFITNLVVCRPCDGAGQQNREPRPDEVMNCRSRLIQIMHIAKPKGIVLLGRTASVYAPDSTLPILEMKHPSYLARTGGVHSRHFKGELVALDCFIGEVTDVKGT